MGEAGSVIASMFLALLFYMVILGAFKLLGKRELNQMSAMDIVMNILIANIAASGIVDEEFWLDALAGVVVIVIVQLIVAKLQIKKPKLRDLIDGEPSMIVINGRIDYGELAKLRIDLDDFVMLLRESNVVSVADIQYGIIERNGKLTVYTKKQPTSVFPLPLIVSGDIKPEALKSLNKTKEWLLESLQTHQLHDLKKIELLFYEENKFTVYCQQQIKKIKLNT